MGLAAGLPALLGTAQAFAQTTGSDKDDPILSFAVNNFAGMAGAKKFDKAWFEQMALVASFAGDYLILSGVDQQMSTAIRNEVRRRGRGAMLADLTDPAHTDGLAAHLRLHGAHVTGHDLREHARRLPASLQESFLDSMEASPANSLL